MIVPATSADRPAYPPRLPTICAPPAHPPWRQQDNRPARHLKDRRPRTAGAMPALRGPESAAS
ncbi:hypothetical protein IEO21_10173 [Rhodonia placenta]|uniref:Uncharacterized protein n=1 Tax=Rhodonia placenta TaxID=104341 RepID=A0A8H7NT20_9APHY|nr:hypothetical protein IEO21_10173 [Postia placenta]